MEKLHVLYLLYQARHARKQQQQKTTQPSSGVFKQKKKSSNFCMKTPNVSIVFKKEITENNGMYPPNQTYVITRGQKPLPLNITANNCTAVLA